MDKFVSWAIFLALIGGCYVYYSQNKTQPGRARGRSINRNTTTTGKGDTKWLESETKKKTAPKKKKAPAKSVKKAAQDVAEKVEAVASGADADDDDLSSGNSPSLGASIASKMPSGKDVSDMLEPKAAAANVMRIVPSTQPARQNKQQPKAEAPKETKKQRQNKKKAEEAKAAREEAEKERKILAEKQRRTAREARGEPAKNGMKSAAPASNAWASERPAAEVVSAGVPEGQLLDTFEPEAAPAKTNGSVKAPESQDWTNGVSEEDQLRAALEETAWETVPKGKKQRKGKAPESVGDDTETSAPVEPTPFKPVKAPVVEKKVENQAPESRYAPLQSVPDVKHPMDSDWGVV